MSQNFLKTMSSILLTLLIGSLTQAKIIHQKIEYKDGATALEGVLVYDDTKTGPRPGVLIAHNWMGISPETERKAEMIAELGYVAFAADLYGKSVRPKDLTSGEVKWSNPI